MSLWSNLLMGSIQGSAKVFLVYWASRLPHQPFRLFLRKNGFPPYRLANPKSSAVASQEAQCGNQADQY